MTIPDSAFEYLPELKDKMVQPENSELRLSLDDYDTIDANARADEQLMSVYNKRPAETIKDLLRDHDHVVACPHLGQQQGKLSPPNLDNVSPRRRQQAPEGWRARRARR